MSAGDRAAEGFLRSASLLLASATMISSLPTAMRSASATGLPEALTRIDRVASAASE
jgi:hypothetical protein